MPPVSITFSGDTLAAALAAAALACGARDSTGAVADEAASAPKPAPRTRKAPEAAPAPASAPAAAQAPVAAPAADGEALKKQAIAKLVTLINANDALGRNGRQVCTDLCNTFGGKNISAIPPTKYQAVIAAVDKALAALESDPAA